MQEKIQIFSPIKQRILQFADTLNISRRQFYKKTGISRGTLENQSGITEETLTKIIAAFQNISPTWLITGAGSMTLSTRSTHMTVDLSKKVKSINANREDIYSNQGIPYFEFLPASAGDFPTFLNQEKPTSFIDLPQLTGCTAVLPVYGSSMKGVVEPGDLIAIKEVVSRDEFDPSLPYLVITDEHRMVKYLRVDEDDHSVIWAESTNHARIKLSTDNIKMVYAIKCVIRFF